MLSLNNEGYLNMCISFLLRLNKEIIYHRNKCLNKKWQSHETQCWKKTKEIKQEIRIREEGVKQENRPSKKENQKSKNKINSFTWFGKKIKRKFNGGKILTSEDK